MFMRLGCYYIKTNMFGFEHVLYFSLPKTISKSMIGMITNNAKIIYKYLNNFSRLHMKNTTNCHSCISILLHEHHNLLH
jgi:hypothetical protein